MALNTAANREVALVDVLDSALNKGVVLWGDAVITLADVDLAYVGIKVLLSSVEAANRMREAAGLPALLIPASSGAATALPVSTGRNPVALPASTGRNVAALLPAIAPRRAGGTAGTANSAPGNGPQHLQTAPNTDPAATERGLAQLVLTVVELLRQLMERQALHRVEGGGLSDEAIERLGQTLLGLEERMDELKQIFNLDDGDLNLSLGPLGNLL